MRAEASVELSHYLVIVRRRWWALLAAGCMAAGAAYIVAAAAPPTYESRARILVGPIGSTDLNTLRASQSLVETYAQLATSQPVLDEVIERLALPTTVPVLEEQVVSTADALTRLLAITVQAGDPDDAAQIANEIAAVIIDLPSTSIPRVESQMRLADPAVPDTDPVSPDAALIAALAFAAGLVSVFVLVLLADNLSDTVRSRHEIPLLTSADVLGVVPIPNWFHPSPAKPLVVEEYPESRVADAYRLTAAKVFTASDIPLRSVLITGTDPSPAIGQFAANLAAVLARTGLAITLVDAVESDSSTTDLFHATDRPGLSDLLARHAGVTRTAVDLLRIPRPPGMSIIPRGLSRMRLIDERQARRAVEVVSSDNFTAIMIASPGDRSGSTLVWAHVVDAVILVLERDRSRRSAVSGALESLNVVSARVIGVVLLEHRRMYRLLPHRERSVSAAAGHEAGK